MSHEHPPKFNVRESFNMGMKAYEQGLTICDEPPEMSPGQKSLWRAGWEHAQLDAEESLNQEH